MQGRRSSLDIIQTPVGWRVSRATRNCTLPLEAWGKGWDQLIGYTIFMALFSNNSLWNSTGKIAVSRKVGMLPQMSDWPPAWMLRNWGDGAQVGSAQGLLIWDLAWGARAGSTLAPVQEWSGQGVQPATSLPDLLVGGGGRCREHNHVKQWKDGNYYLQGIKITFRWTHSSTEGLMKYPTVYSQVVLEALVFLEDLVFLVFPRNQRETDNSYCDSILF